MRVLRKDLGLSMAEVAKYLGVREMRVQALELGTAAATWTEANMLADLYNVSSKKVFKVGREVCPRCRRIGRVLP